MTKHIGRKHRWQQEDARRYSSDLGSVVFERGAWYARLRYRIPASAEQGHELPVWQSQDLRLGPFKRPRNAMVALEREVAFLRNRHGEDIQFGDQSAEG